MRHTFAIHWLLSPLSAIALLTSALAVDTVETIEGERYEDIKILKMESDGVIVKHSKGIAKIPFYELDEATLTALGHSGEVTPPIRHSTPPESGLLPDIEGAEVAADDLDLDADLAESADSTEPAVAGKKSSSKVTVRSKSTNAPVKATAVAPASKSNKRVYKIRKRVEAGVGAVGVSSWHNGRKVAQQVHTHTHEHSHHRGASCGGCGNFPTITTRYTPYGNVSYYGRPSHWYGYYNPPCNRCRFEKVDYRRWQGRR